MQRLISKAIIKKDLIDIWRSKPLMITMIIIPFLFSVIFPALVVGSALLFDLEKIAGEDEMKIIDSFIASSLGDTVSSLTIEQQIVFIFINFLLPTFFLLVPIITAMTTAANSFVGEKEKRTFESLLLSPISIKSLYISKVIGSFIPPFLVSIVSFVICGIVINSLAYPLFGELIFPSANWVALIVGLSPMLILLVVLINIFISAKAKTYQEAQNIGGVIVLPVVAMLIGQVSGLFFIGVQLMMIISIGVLVVNIILLNMISKNNDRFDLFEKQIH